MDLTRWVKKVPRQTSSIPTPSDQIPEKFKKPESSSLISCDHDCHPSAVTMFVDGSCFGNNRRKNTGRAGIGVVFPDFMSSNVSEKLPGENATNNRAELYAIIRGFEIVNRAIDPFRRRQLIIKTDSELSMNICNKWMKQWKRRGWKKADNQVPSNLDLLLQLDKLLEGRNVTVKHVRAHTMKTDEDSLMNARADALAKAGAMM